MYLCFAPNRLAIAWQDDTLGINQDDLYTQVIEHPSMVMESSWSLQIINICYFSPSDYV